MEVLILFIAMAREEQDRRFNREEWDEEWSNMSPYDRREATRPLYDFYNVDTGAQGANRRPGANYSGEPVLNEEDLRASLNAAMISGPAGDFAVYTDQDLPTDVSGMVGFHQNMADQHQGGGSFNSPHDVFDLTRVAWGEAFEDLEFQGPEEPETEPDPVEDEEDPYMPSAQVKAAADNTEMIHEARRTGNYFSDAIFNPDEFAGKYVLGLQEGMQDSVQSNLRNSIDMVLGKGGQTSNKIFGT